LAPAAIGGNSSAFLACLPGLQAVLAEFQDIRLAFGESDEYSFVFHKDCQLYGELAAAGASGWQRRRLLRLCTVGADTAEPSPQHHPFPIPAFAQ
jgi:hypothetical protein